VRQGWMTRVNFNFRIFVYIYISSFILFVAGVDKILNTSTGIFTNQKLLFAETFPADMYSDFLVVRFVSFMSRYVPIFQPIKSEHNQPLTYLIYWCLFIFGHFISIGMFSALLVSISVLDVGICEKRTTQESCQPLQTFLFSTNNDNNCVWNDNDLYCYYEYGRFDTLVRYITKIPHCCEKL